MQINFEPVITAVLASIGYAALFYVKSELPDLADKSLEETIKIFLSRFNYTKFIATLLVGIAVGLIVSIRGDPLTQETFELQIAVYGAYVATVENILKTIYRAWKTRAGK